MSKDKKEKTQEQAQPKLPNITWDDSEMQSTYANVCNASSTREEVSLFFGTNQTWNFNQGQNEVAIKLNNRVVLSPFAAKRLSILLENVLKQYEASFGKLDLQDVNANAPAPENVQ